MPRSIYNTTNAAATSGTVPVTVFSTFADSPLTIGGMDYTPSFALRGNDATASTWPVHAGSGLSLALTSSGSPAAPTTSVATPIEGMLGVTNGDANTFWADASSAAMDLVANEGVIVEIIYKFTGTGAHLANRTSSSLEGITFNSTNKANFTARDTDGDAAARQNSGTLVADTWHYCLGGMSRVTSASRAFMFENLSGMPSYVAASCDGSLTSSTGVCVGGLTGNVSTGPTGWIAVYRSSDFSGYSDAQITTAATARLTLLGYTVGDDIV